jgi:hypothetical protein
MDYLIGAFVSLLPERYRRWWDIVPMDSIVSGGVEAVVCCWFFLWRYVAFIETEMTNVVPENFILGAAQKRGETGIMALGMFFLVQYFISFTSLALVYFAFEGLFRAAAASISGEAVASLPFHIFEILHMKLMKLFKINSTRKCEHT